MEKSLYAYGRGRIRWRRRGTKGVCNRREGHECSMVAQGESARVSGSMVVCSRRACPQVLTRDARHRRETILQRHVIRGLRECGYPPPPPQAEAADA